MVLVESIRAGLGLGWTLTAVGDREASFVRMTDPKDSFGGSLWLLTHEDLRTTPRFRALLAYLAEADVESPDRIRAKSLRTPTSTLVDS